MDETERDVFKLKMDLEALAERLKERQERNDERIAELEKVVGKIKEERAKLGGMAILLVALGSMLLWFSSVGSNIAKVVGR